MVPAPARREGKARGGVWRTNQEKREEEEGRQVVEKAM